MDPRFGQTDEAVRPTVIHPVPQQPLIQIDLPSLFTKIDGFARRLPWWVWFLGGIFIPKWTARWWAGRKRPAREED
jgi:preprotein translocase subunit Sec63